jgi:NAD-dependent deacetylase
MDCETFYTAEYVKYSRAVPRCTCGGIIKPDVVLYQESLKPVLLDQAAQYLRDADLLIIGGTSLSVYPAAGLIEHFNGRNIVLINKTPTGFDEQARLILNSSIGEVLSQI